MFEKPIPTFDSPESTAYSINNPAFRDVVSQAPANKQKYRSSPTAWEDEQLYFLLPDRFSDNLEDGVRDVNDRPVPGQVKKFKPVDDNSAITTSNDAQAWRDAGKVWQGGNLRGIKSKLGYLRRLGVSGIWVGPIFKQVAHDENSYHGYAVQNFLEIDPHFGTREDLRDLVSAAHEQDIYVILDIILNHSGDVFDYKVQGQRPWNGQKYDVEGFRDASRKPTIPFQPLDLTNPTKELEECAIWPVELQSSDSFTCEGEIRNWDNFPEYLRGDFFSLKDINLGSSGADDFTATPALRTLCEVYKYWIAFADLDGFRIDTVKHMGDGPTRYLCTTLHEFASTIGKENFFLVGEVTGGKAFDTVEATGLDAALGIGNVQRTLWLLPKGYVNPSEYFDMFRNATFLRKGSNAWTRNKVVTMIDDHDQVWRPGDDKARFCSESQGDALAVAAVALNLCTLGIPCIYYGTEQQFDGRGGGDWYIREAMFGGKFGAFRSVDRHFFDESNTVYQEISKISKIRSDSPVLRRGRQYLREISSDGTGFGVPHILGGRMMSVVAWSRIFADEEILCAINTDPNNWTTAYAVIDAGLNKEGDILKCLYAYPTGGDRVVPQEVVVKGLNGAAVALEVPPAGFVMYGKAS